MLFVPQVIPHECSLFLSNPSIDLPTWKILDEPSVIVAKSHKSPQVHQSGRNGPLFNGCYLLRIHIHSLIVDYVPQVQNLNQPKLTLGLLGIKLLLLQYTKDNSQVSKMTLLPCSTKHNNIIRTPIQNLSNDSIKYDS